MTRKERAQVVELLRCCADECNFNSNSGLYGTASQLGYARWDTPKSNPRIWKWAVAARNSVQAEGAWTPYDHECLEAAQRVEEGWEP